MIKLNFPAIHCTDMFANCLSSAGAGSYKLRLSGIADTIKSEWGKFDVRSHSKNFHLFKPCEPRDKQQKIVGNVTKDDLMKLYSVHMLNEKKDSRKVYDILRACSNGICPLCGIHGASTLDHYLPKARYPMLSVYPKNLIPACKDCNGGKAATIFESASDQTLYPYNDDLKFYKTEWVSARITASFGILTFVFFPSPPEKWLKVEKNRVISHFNGFNLESKYQLNAAQFVSTITADIRRLLTSGNGATVKKHYLELASQVPKNSTLRVMYNAIANDDTICNGNF